MYASIFLGYPIGTGKLWASFPFLTYVQHCFSKVKLTISTIIINNQYAPAKHIFFEQFGTDDTGRLTIVA
jgi:hypothetical protein